MNRNIETYHASFETAQMVFDNQLDTADHSQRVLTSPAQASLEVVTAVNPNSQGFYPVTIDIDRLRDMAGLVINRVLLIPNAQLGVLSPAIITQDAKQQGKYQITRLNQPFDPEVGFSDGMHFGLSVKSQTRVAGFGGHGAAGGFEQGHFSAVLLGAHNDQIADALAGNGDKATHAILANGVSETMAQQQMLPLPIFTKPLRPGERLQLFWHSKLEAIDGPMAGDYPDATRLMLGAGIQALGDRGIDKARGLVDSAIRAPNE